MTLSQFQTQDGLFEIAPFDHRSSLATSLALDLSKADDQKTFLHLKHLFMKTLSPHVSAVLTDPEYGIKTLKDKAVKCGLFLSLEASGYGDDRNAPTTLLPNWGIDGVKSHDAGAKLLVYYNPQSKTASEKLELVKTLSDEAHRKNVVFLVEPVLYPLKKNTLWEHEWDDAWVQTHLEMCSVFAPFCDILKIQYPGNAQACARVTRMHPQWILLSRGITYDEFVPYLTVAVRQGCRGYAAGRAVWQELTTLPSQAWEKFLASTAVNRLHELSSVLRANLFAH